MSNEIQSEAPGMILHGDCLEQMRGMEAESVDAIVTDPPYGWRFMGKAWDTFDILEKAKQGRRPGETFVGSDGVTRKTREKPAESAGKYDQTVHGNLKFMQWTSEWAREAMRVLKPGGVVLDPFMGSGSTGVACKTLGFEFIGIEREAEYVEIAERRISL